jgi:hypothetical protein
MTGRISPLEPSDDSPAPDPVEAPAQTGDAPREASREASDLAAVRELVLRAHPDVVPELIGGQSVAAVLASVEPAQAAYARLAEQVTANRAGEPPAPVAPAAPNVPAGGSPPVPVDPERLPAAEKIRRGIRARSS